MGIKYGGHCCGRNWFLDSITGVIPTSSPTPDPLADMEFIMTFTDLGTLPTGITAWDSLANWNTKLRFSGTAFTSILVDTATFRVGLSGAVDFKIKHLCFKDYTKLVKVQEYANSVTTVYTSAFENCTALTTVLLPAITIAPTAFKGCTALTSVTIPATTQLAGTFWNCTALATLSAPLCTSLGNDTFRGCESLTSVTLSDSLVQVGQRAFYGCIALTSFSNAGVQTLSDSAFYGCTSLASVTMPAVVTISYASFLNCGALTSVTFNNATTVGEIAFSGCTTLASATLPAVVTVGISAFYHCALTTISLPSCLTIDTQAFNSCLALTTALFPVCTTLLSVQTFANCTALTTIELPACTDMGATVINDDTFLNITGNTIAATFNTVLQTCNAGAEDGDIQTLQAANTVTITWV